MKKIMNFEKTAEYVAAMKIINYWRAKKFHQRPDLDSSGYLAEINRNLDQRGVNIAISANPPLMPLQSIDLDAAQKTIDRIARPDLAEFLTRFIQAHVMHITMKDFMCALQASCMKFNLWLMNNPEHQDYTVIYQNGKSQQWVASLALRYLYVLPAYDQNFKLNQTDSLNVMSNHPGRKTFVIFDDNAFTGTQICSQVIARFLEAVQKCGAHEQNRYQLVLITPFMTTKAFQEIKNAIKSAEKRHVDIKLFSNCIIPTLHQLPLRKEPDEVRLLAEVCGSYITDGVAPKLSSSKAAVYTDWKLPDAMSIPLFLWGQLSGLIDKYVNTRPEEAPATVPMLPNVDPPYKSANFRYYSNNSNAQGLFFHDKNGTRRSISEYNNKEEMREDVTTRDFVFL